MKKPEPQKKPKARIECEFIPDPYKVKRPRYTRRAEKFKKERGREPEGGDSD